MNQYKKYEPFFGSWYFEGDNSEIGSGSFGSVYRVVRHDTNVAPAALKIITVPRNPSELETRRSEGMDDIALQKYYQGKVDDIKKEYELMSELKGNSNIVSCEDFMAFRHEDGIGYDIVIRMELLMPLISYENTRQVNELEVMKLGIDMCKALERCEIKNIIHRDIKPDNIFVSDMGDFKLGDFGIARTMEDANLLMSARRGTPNYMAPEVYSAQPYDRTADIYSLGIVLYRMLNNHRTPFLPPPPEELTDKIREQAFVMRMQGIAIPRPLFGDEALKSIVLKACAFNPRERYQHAAQLRGDLEMVRSILEYGGTVPEQFAADLDATVSMTNQDTTINISNSAGKSINQSQFESSENPSLHSHTKIGSKGKIFVAAAIPAIGVIALGAAALSGRMSGKAPQTADTVLQMENTGQQAGGQDLGHAISVDTAQANAISSGAMQTNRTISKEEKERQQQEQLRAERLETAELKVNHIEELDFITEYINLETLDLSELQIKDISFIKEFAKLRKLNISYTNVEDLSVLNACSQLESLNISYNNENLHTKKSLLNVAGITNLTELDMTGNTVVGKYSDELKPLVNLKILKLGSTELFDGSFFSSMKNLEQLDLQGNISFCDISYLLPLTNLTYLNISVTDISDLKGIETLKNLKELDISMTEISDISMLSKLKNLEHLTLTKTKKMQNQVKTLKKTLKNCKVSYQ